MYYYHYEVHSHDDNTDIDSIKDICILGNSFEDAYKCIDKRHQNAIKQFFGGRNLEFITDHGYVTYFFRGSRRNKSDIRSRRPIEYIEYIDGTESPKTFKVTFEYTMLGTIEVEAEDETEAEIMVRDMDIDDLDASFLSNSFTVTDVEEQEEE